MTILGEVATTHSPSMQMYVANMKYSFLLFVGLSCAFVPSFSQFTRTPGPANLRLGITNPVTEIPDPTKLSCFLFEPDILPPGKRFLYTNVVMLSSAVAGHTYLYIRFPADNNFFKKYNTRNLKNTFTRLPMWDTDHWSYNYLAHPYMGSLTYLANRNRGGSVCQSFLFSSLNSVLYEYILASGTQRPSANDLIATPVGGILLGESLFFIKKQLLKDHNLSWVEKVVITLIDPYEVARHRFKYQLLLK